MTYLVGIGNSQSWVDVVFSINWSSWHEDMQCYEWILYYSLMVHMGMRKWDERWWWEENWKSNMRNRDMREFDVQVNWHFTLYHVWHEMWCLALCTGVLYVQLGRMYPWFPISPGISPYYSIHDSLFLILPDQSTITTQYKWNLYFVISSRYNDEFTLTTTSTHSWLTPYQIPFILIIKCWNQNFV